MATIDGQAEVRTAEVDPAREAFERALPGQVYLGPEIAVVGLVDELLALRRHAAELERAARRRFTLNRMVSS